MKTLDKQMIKLELSLLLSNIFNMTISDDIETYNKIMDSYLSELTDENVSAEDFIQKHRDSLSFYYAKVNRRNIKRIKNMVVFFTVVLILNIVGLGIYTLLKF